MASIFSLLLLSVIALCMVTTAVSANDYCKISRAHTMCLYKVDKLGPKCIKGSQIIKLTANDRNTIVDLHNNMRRKVAKGQEKGQSSASNMMELKWDQELANGAQAWANQCRQDHDENENNAVKRFPDGLGQNWFGSSSPKPNWSEVVNDWYKEVKLMKPGYITKFPSDERTQDAMGHYSQVVWAETKYIGCAAVNKKGTFALSVYCNYGTAGNLPGAPIYKKGNPATACPKGSKPTNGLCRF